MVHGVGCHKGLFGCGAALFCDSDSLFLVFAGPSRGGIVLCISYTLP